MEKQKMMESVRGQGTLHCMGEEAGSPQEQTAWISGLPPSSPSCTPLPATVGGSHCLRHTREGPHARGTGLKGCRE